MNNSVIVLSSYQSKYAGNFIPSLLQVQDELQANDIQCIMVLPLKAADREWFKILEKKVKIITVDFNVKKKDIYKRNNKFISNVQCQHYICSLWKVY